jgi:THO complex subunit 1
MDFLHVLNKNVTFCLQVDFFQNEQNTDVERALNMLQIWAEDDEDASPDNLSYTLEGLGLFEAADALKEVTDLMNMG